MPGSSRMSCHQARRSAPATDAVTLSTPVHFFDSSSSRDEHAMRLARAAAKRVRAWAAALRHRSLARAAELSAPANVGDLLVDVRLPVPNVVAKRVLVLGTSTTNDRVTLLADLRDEGSLPADAFDLVVLDRPGKGAGGEAILANAVAALRPGGVLVMGGPAIHPLPPGSSAFEGQRRRHVLWCVTVVRRAA